MDNGKLEESGLTKEVLDNPKNIRTKEFLQKIYKILFFTS